MISGMNAEIACMAEITDSKEAVFSYFPRLMTPFSEIFVIKCLTDLFFQMSKTLCHDNVSAGQKRVPGAEQ